MLELCWDHIGRGEHELRVGTWYEVVQSCGVDCSAVTGSKYHFTLPLSNLRVRQESNLEKKRAPQTVQGFVTVPLSEMLRAHHPSCLGLTAGAACIL